MKKLQKLIQQLIQKKLNQNVDKAYNQILQLVRNWSRKLSDDDAYQLSQKLSKFFDSYNFKPIS